MGPFGIPGLGAMLASAMTLFSDGERLVPPPRKRPKGQRLVHTSTVVDEALHRIPGTERFRRVPVKRAVHLDNSKDYRGRLSAKDKARRERALGVS